MCCWFVNYGRPRNIVLYLQGFDVMAPSKTFRLSRSDIMRILHNGDQHTRVSAHVVTSDVWLFIMHVLESCALTYYFIVKRKAQSQAVAQRTHFFAHQLSLWNRMRISPLWNYSRGRNSFLVLSKIYRIIWCAKNNVIWTRSMTIIFCRNCDPDMINHPPRALCRSCAGK